MSGISRPDLAVASWKWGSLFQARHVNAWAEMFGRCLKVPHRLVCVTNDPSGIAPGVDIVPMPTDYAETPRCRRRMQGFSREMSAEFGRRVLYCDLDLVLVGDITAIVDRPEPIVGWKVGHAGVMSGSFLLADAGALDGAWRRFQGQPEAWPRRLSAGVASDQAMLNDWLSTQPPIPFWTERDGFVTFYGRGYERKEYLGVGPNRRQLPAGARIVVLGSADLAVLDDDTYPWVRDHYQREVAA